MTGDSASASVFVAVAPDVAFEVFTNEIDLWWRTGVRFRIAGKRRGQLALEPRLGGRLFETFEVPTGSHTFDVGRVTAWDPPAGLDLEWRASNFAPDEKTFVTVRFEPSNGGTRVTVRHSGWSALRADHPVRHGEASAAFLRTMGLWWGDLLTSLRLHVAKKPDETSG